MEIEKVVNQTTHPALALIAQRPELFSRQGSVVATWRGKGEQRRGPYYQLTYREAGRQCWVYLGKAGAVVDAVRNALEPLQCALRCYREFQRLRRSAMASLRIEKSKMAQEFRKLGLQLKGFEVRGWRSLGVGRMDATALDRQAKRAQAAAEGRQRSLLGMLGSLGLRLPRLPRPPMPPSPEQLVRSVLNSLGIRRELFALAGSP